jgi:uncharacterized SAM-binding protein YcdF (DUF218 family)
MFLLKKLITALILPLNFCFVLVIIGSLILFTRRRNFGKSLIIAGLCLLFLLSFPPVSGLLTNKLESRYPALSNADLSKSNIRWIVVLGGGHNSSNPVGSQLSASSLARVVEGVRIYRMKTGRKLLLSGGPVYDRIPNADVMRDEARILGIPDADITLEAKSRDTEEEARFLSPVLNQEEFFLVTSAVHMPRSMALFRQQKMKPIAAPTDYSFQSQNVPLIFRFLPNAGALQQSERALREYLGLLWYRIRGKA